MINYITLALLTFTVVLTYKQHQENKRIAAFMRGVREEAREVWMLTIEAVKVLDMYDDATANLLRAKIADCTERHKKIIDPLL